MARYEFKQGRSRWFWDVTLTGTTLTTVYGQVGTPGATTHQEHPSIAAAKKRHVALLAHLHRQSLTPLAGAALSRALAKHARAVAAAPQRRGSPFEVSLAELKRRLEASGLSKGLMTPLRAALRLDHPDDWDSNDLALWVDEPWDTVAPKRLRASPTNTVAVVFTQPIHTKRPLVMRYSEMLGFDAQRDGKVFVFLEPVHTSDFCMVPDCVAVFAKGLTVDRLASFDGADSSTTVAGVLAAPYVISGVSGGWVNLEPKTRFEVANYARYVPKLPPRA